MPTISWALHGCEAFRINGDAMVAARHAKAFDRYGGRQILLSVGAVAA